MASATGSTPSGGRWRDPRAARDGRTLDGGVAPLGHSTPRIRGSPARTACSSAKAWETFWSAGKPASSSRDRFHPYVDQDLQATTGSAGDVLRDLPSVEVDADGNISLRGDLSVTVLIDGKPVSQMQGANRAAALQSISAGDIEQIEVITAPSAEFKPDGSGGIINIVTKKKHPVSAALLSAYAGTGLPAGIAKRVRFPVHGRIILLHAPVVPLANHPAIGIENCRTDWYSPFLQPLPRLLQSNPQHRRIVELYIHAISAGLLNPTQKSSTNWPPCDSRANSLFC